jgi:RimJ/RimL family protein N-acetyltransferase
MITGKTVHLRPIQPADLPLLLAWRYQPALYTAFEEFDPIAEPQQQAWYQAMLQNATEKNFIIALNHPSDTQDNGKAIGLIALQAIHARNRTAELGRLLIGDNTYSGSGLGVEAEALLLWYAFEHLNLHKLSLHVLSGNNPSVCALHAGLGFVHEATLKQHVFKAGGYQDRLIMAMFVADYWHHKKTGLLGQLLRRCLLPVSATVTGN